LNGRGVVAPAHCKSLIYELINIRRRTHELRVGSLD
jgi:hypothetical protein